MLIVCPLALHGSDFGLKHNRPADFVGTQSCASASCHGAPQGRVPDSALGREYLVWLGADPHAHAAQRMLEPRFQEVLRRASQWTDGRGDPAMERKCAACHDPSLLYEPQVQVLSTQYVDTQPCSALSQSALATTLTPALSQRETDLSSHGIACETCHGGARRWISRHYERGVSRQELLDAGMTDTKDLLVRARLCTTCHVGSADHDMNHDMIAAGHPPLRFEQASYEALIARKHWDDRPVRRAEADYEVKIWAAGRMASAQAALELLEQRATRAAQSAASQIPAAWPEFSESNCFACHQPLRARDDGARVFTTQLRGVPPWQTWNTALSEPFGSSTLQLRSSMGASWAPEPAAIARLAHQARDRLSVGWRLSEMSSTSVLNQLKGAGETATWDEGCQRLAALIAVERSQRDRGAIDALASKAWHERAQRVAAQLRFSPADRQWPKLFNEPNASLAEVSREMAALGDELRRAAGTTGSGVAP